MKRLATLLTWLALSYALLLGALFVVESRFAERHWLLTTVAWAPQYPWLLGALLLAALAAIARSTRALVISLGAALFAAIVLMGFALPVGRGSAATTTVRLLTLNAGTGRARPEALRALLAEARPDVVCLQEAALTLAGLTDGARLEGPLEEFTVVKDREMAVLSRLPIVGRSVHRMGFDTGREVLEVRVRAGERELTVLSTHFFRGRAEASSGRVGRALADLTRSGEIHARQTERLLEVAAGASRPQVIVGDLNLPPRGRLYRRLTEHHTDAFRAAGVGYGYSFPAGLPMLRIDYVLSSPELGVRHCRTYSRAGSDHRAVLAELTFR